MARVAAVLAIVLGTFVVGFSPNRWDVVILTLPRGHGVHSHEVVGTMLIAFGTAVLWLSPRWR